MNKKISIVLLSILSVIIGIWIWTLATPNKSIILGGSTSVNPFMQKITKEYLKESNSNDFVYNSTGSQAGVRGVEKNMYAAGFISKDLSKDTLSNDNYKWFDFEKNKISCQHDQKCKLTEKNFDDIFKNIYSTKVKENESFLALEFAADAIAIVYNSPSWFNQKVNKVSLNDLMNFSSNNDENLKKIYEGQMTWTELATSIAKNTNCYNDFKDIINANSSTNQIVKYTREDGSGTRSAFSELTGIKSMPTAQVANSNGSMLSKVKASPSIGYVSYSIFPSIEINGTVRVAGIDGKKLGNPFDNKSYEAFGNESWEWKGNEWIKYISNEQLIRTDYSFKRPFIAVFKSVSYYYDQLQSMFKYMLINPKSKEIFEEEGLIQNFNFILV